MSEIVCKCGVLIMKSYGNGKTKIRSKILVFDDSLNKSFAVCRSCGEEHEVPVKIGPQPIARSISHFIFDKK